MRELLGVGWWKHDPEKAQQAAADAGFKKAGNAWMQPDGTPFTITIIAPADFEVESQRLAFAVANEWTQFGIPTPTSSRCRPALFFTAENTGDYRGRLLLGLDCAIGPTSVRAHGRWHKDYVRPNGTGLVQPRADTQMTSSAA